MDHMPLKTSPSDPKELDFPVQNRLMYDWLSLSFRGMTVEDMIDLLGLRGCPWEIMTSGNGYTYRHFFNQISISFAEDLSHVNGFLLLEMSGQGCRAFETYGTGDFDSLFRLVRGEMNKKLPERNFRLTRLDVAFDDVTGLLDINQICDYTRKEYFTCRMKTYEVIYGSRGNSSTFGRKGSNVFIRIYDKARERGFTECRHWIRCELQLRSDAAVGFCSQLSDAEPWSLYSGVLSHYLMFREPGDDSNKSRWEVCSWWLTFLDHARTVSLLSHPGVLYNLSKAEKYFFTQPIGTVKTLLKIYGTDKFIKMIKDARMPNNPKYYQLVSTVEADYQRSLRHVDEYIEYDSEDVLLEGLEDRQELKAEQEYIDQLARSKSTSRRSSLIRKSKTSFVPRSVTCFVCGFVGPVDKFWTYKGLQGECFNCRT